MSGCYPEKLWGRFKDVRLACSGFCQIHCDRALAAASATCFLARQANDTIPGAHLFHFGAILVLYVWFKQNIHFPRVTWRPDRNVVFRITRSHVSLPYGPIPAGFASSYCLFRTEFAPLRMLA